MQPGGVAGGDLERVPQVAPGCDPASLEMTPAEGYLLSRIDGHTPWRLLREIGGLPTEQVDACLEKWLEEGVIEVAQRPTGEKQKARSRVPEAVDVETGGSASTGAPGIDESLLDSDLDLDLETQRRILEFESGLERNYFALLAVPRDVDARSVKRAYFTLSKEFHPDRYFRREIGHFTQRLERIFKKVLEAYELLSDPMARAEVEKSMAVSAAPPGPAAAAESSQEATRTTASAPPLTPLERLRQRMPFKIPERLIVERRQKAGEFFQSAKLSQRMGNYVAAAGSIRLAIAFDPYNTEYKSHLSDIQAKAAEMKASQILEKMNKDEGFAEGDQLGEALKLLEEVLLYRPHDPELNARIARLALDLEDVDKARECIERALEHSPEVASYHTTLALVHRASGNRGHAIRELETALKLDPQDSEIRSLIAGLRTSRRTMSKGGRE
jgi:curved DNA-binding protein CbpA